MQMYVEGYLQALLDVVYKQDYLRVKVTDDEVATSHTPRHYSPLHSPPLPWLHGCMVAQVVLKNLPPNTQLSAEVVATVHGFLVGEGLLAGQSSAQGTGTLRRLKGEAVGTVCSRCSRHGWLRLWLCAVLCGGAGEAGRSSGAGVVRAAGRAAGGERDEEAGVEGATRGKGGRSAAQGGAFAPC